MEPTKPGGRQIVQWFWDCVFNFKSENIKNVVTNYHTKIPFSLCAFHCEGWRGWYRDILLADTLGAPPTYIPAHLLTITLFRAYFPQQKIIHEKHTGSASEDIIHSDIDDEHPSSVQVETNTLVFHHDGNVRVGIILCGSEDYHSLFSVSVCVKPVQVTARSWGLMSSLSVQPLWNVALHTSRTLVVVAISMLVPLFRYTDRGLSTTPPFSQIHFSMDTYSIPDPVSFEASS